MKSFIKTIIFTIYLFCCISAHSQTLYLYADLPNAKIEIKDSVYSVYLYHYYNGEHWLLI